MRLLLIFLLCCAFCRTAQAVPTVITGKVNPKARLYFWGYHIQKIDHWHRGFADSTGYFSVTIDVDAVQIGWFFQVPIFLFPGDTVTVSYGRVHTFHSKLYGDDLNFLPAIENKLVLQTALQTYGYPNSQYFEAYRKRVGEATAQRLRFLDSFHRAQPLDPRLLQMYRQEIRSRELLDLYTALGIPRLRLDSVPAQYLREADSLAAFLHQDALMYSSLYRRAATAYAIYQLKAQGIQYSALGVLARFEQAKQFFTGHTREYVWFIQLALYAGTYVPAYTACYDYFMQQAADTAYRNYLARHFAEVNRQRHLFQEEQFTAFHLHRATGDSITLGQLLHGWKGKVVYVDFWASWCAPCVVEMPASHALAAELKDKGVEFVYISLDTDRDKWLKGMDTHRVRNNTYLVQTAFCFPAGQGT